MMVGTSWRARVSERARARLEAVPLGQNGAQLPPDLLRDHSGQLVFRSICCYTQLEAAEIRLDGDVHLWCCCGDGACPQCRQEDNQQCNCQRLVPPVHLPSRSFLSFFQMLAYLTKLYLL
ncbi:MAG: hypothetical protein QM219_05695 [Bacillota bacterium]|nr:hypothetical protein [Bacillota bacterium]